MKISPLPKSGEVGATQPISFDHPWRPLGVKASISEAAVLLDKDQWTVIRDLFEDIL